MICCFFGHRDANGSIKKELSDVIGRLINEGVKHFYVGNNGNFDYYVQETISGLINSGQDLQLTVVISRIDEKPLFEGIGYTLFPQELEPALPRYAISKRNDWIIKRSTVAVIYCRRKFSNSYELLQKAEKKGLRVITILS